MNTEHTRTKQPTGLILHMFCAVNWFKIFKLTTAQQSKNNSL